MAFSNLWSSERLSFSLSIIAVISAAITTYHQFHQEIDIAFRVSMPTSVPSYGDPFFPNEDTLSIPFTFVNSGTTPVSLVRSRVWISVHDTLDLHGTLYGDQDTSTTIQTGVFDSGTTGYFSIESITQLQFNLSVDSNSLAHLLEKAPRREARGLYYGVSLDMICPDGNSARTSTALGMIFYDTTTTNCIYWNGFNGVGGYDLYAIPPFEPRKRIQLEPY